MILLFLGIWQCMAAWTFHFDHALVDIISGLLIIFLSPWQKGRYFIALIGVWLQFTPLLFWVDALQYINNTLVGIGVIAVSMIFEGEHAKEGPSIPSGWSYNPSAFNQRLPVALLALVCWFISRYLAAYQLGYIDSIWDPFFNTEAVLTSSISRSFPVSDAGMGALVYTLEFLSTCMGGKARFRTSPWKVFIFGLLVVPAGIISIILVILQPLVVGNWCTLCLITAACMLFAIPPSIDELVASIQYLNATRWRTLFTGGDSLGAKNDRKKRSWKNAFFGLSVPWYRLILIPIGIYLMTEPQFFDPILGSFLIVITILSISKHLAKIRFVNFALAILILILAWTFQDHPIEHTLAALLIGLLSL